MLFVDIAGAQITASRPLGNLNPLTKDQSKVLVTILPFVELGFFFWLVFNSRKLF